ncbi:hypothetical protein BpHYR1_025714 [Brachionus plicatilis]|uniref:Uncharacterized protein n=1 Tax=Brachionus plicatilis TaxID=10195 RepID=A0A3M7RF04_BRAPC|nr:hypothetical protein BpHYR1_025714 [Brachionus plicatilis]
MCSKLSSIIDLIRFLYNLKMSDLASWCIFDSLSIKIIVKLFHSNFRTMLTKNYTTFECN